MLREAFEYLTTPCGHEAQRLGYLAEVVALGARWRRQRRAWSPHVTECKRFIGDAMTAAPAGGRALVAGSGLLIEIPLEAMAARFDEVVLADLIHARSVRRHVRRYPNVRLVELDVSGSVSPLLRSLGGNTALPIPDPPAPPGGRFAFAVSCNLLSQLPLLPLEAIEKKAPTMPETERAAFAQALARSHLVWLSGAADHAALFTDTDSQWLEKGRIVEREDSLWGLTLPPPDRSWSWDIAPAPEQDRRRDLRHGVGAWFDVQRLLRQMISL